MFRKSKNDVLIKESIDFISKNMDITIDKIPRNYLQFWLECDRSSIQNNEEVDNEQEWIIFMYALVKSHQIKGENEFGMTIIEIHDLYKGWQMLIAIYFASDMANMKVTPFKLFDFENYERLVFDFCKK